MVMRGPALLVAICPVPGSLLLWAFADTPDIPTEPAGELDPATRATLLLALWRLSY